MSLLSTVTTDINGVTKSSILNGDLAQLVIALGLLAVYLVELIMRLGQDQFIGGALVAVIAFYFGGKNSNTSATNAATNTLNAAVASPINGTTTS